jgi:hypothetical protein
MLVHTSQNGFVLEGNPDAPQNTLAQAVLYDFDIDGHKLKPDHKTWLSDQLINAIPVDPNRRLRLSITGKTSRTGGAAHNKHLSEQRAKVALRYINAHLRQHGTMQISAIGVGKEQARGKLEEDAGDRAVEVAIQDLDAPPTPVLITNPCPMPMPTPMPMPVPTPVKPSPQPDPPPPAALPIPQTSKQFTIQQVGAGAVTPVPGAAIDVMMFMVQESARPENAAYYIYVGGGVGGSLNPFGMIEKMARLKTLIDTTRSLRLFKGFLKKGAATVSGPKNPFSITARLTTTAWDFSGFAGFGSASASLGTSYSYNEFFFGSGRPWPGNSFSAVTIHGFQTANTVGLPSGSATLGYMECISSP